MTKERGTFMIDKLRKIFPSLIVHKDNANHLDSNYKWFITDDHEIIGIPKNEITDKDISLLIAFLSPYNVNLPIPTNEEQKWQDYIHSTEPKSDIELKSTYRFVYFSMRENQIDPILFKDAIHELFAKQVPILWDNGHEGIIIEEQTMVEESIAYDQIINVLMSDLYVNINFFVGPFQTDLADIQHQYHSLIKAAKIVFLHSKKAVVTYVDAVPYLLIDQSKKDLRLDITQTILQEYIDDEDTLKMIETFVQFNLNLSETSKELYMHRNSLQYRLDRFFEKTGIDVRQFHHAMAVYLALLAKK